MAAMLAVIDPGDEVIAFQPYYENYGPDGLLSGANLKWVDLKPPAWEFDFDDLKRAFSDRTRAIIVNTPHNPTGKVFRREELQLIADLCNKYNAIAITDEIYEHIIYVDRPHLSIAAFDGMSERTITISGHSKTFSATGWRLGYCIAPEEISNGIRRVHDFLTVGAPHPLQMAGAAALRMPTEYYVSLLEDYRKRREVFMYDRGARFRILSCRSRCKTESASLIEKVPLPSAVCKCDAVKVPHRRGCRPLN